MLINSVKIILGVAVGFCLLQAGYAADKAELRAARSAVGSAVGSVRSTMSRREATLDKPVAYGKPETLYHPVCAALFKGGALVTDWSTLDALVTANEGNEYLPQLPRRVRNVVVDVGMFSIAREVKGERTEQANVYAVNLIQFLLRGVFAKSEIDSWQDSFAAVAVGEDVPEFLTVVRDQPKQALAHPLYTVWSGLFFGADGVLQRYDGTRQKDEKLERINTFGLFESSLAKIVTERSITRLQREGEERTAALEARLQEERTARAEAEAARVAADAKRDDDFKALAAQLAELRSAQAAAAPQPAQTQAQPRQQQAPARQQQSSGNNNRGCSMM